MRFSVVVPAYNEEGRLLDTLEGLCGAFGGEAELVVVDDGSSDSTYAKAV